MAEDKIIIVGKLQASSSDGKGMVRFVIREHKGAFKPTGTILMELDKQATDDQATDNFNAHPMIKDWIQNLTGKKVTILIE